MIRTTLSRLSTRTASFRYFSSPASDKLRSILEDYREKNYGQTLFNRYVKEMIAATDVNHDGMISLSELKGLLKNIDAETAIDGTLIEKAMEELGAIEIQGEEKVVPAERIESLILNPRHEHAIHGYHSAA